MKNELAPDRVARHPISVVAQRTGLTTDVLRVWERRYGAVIPGRGPGGQRIYSDADIARLRLLRDATLGGRAIGQVAALPQDELARMVAEDADARGLRAGEWPVEMREALAEAAALAESLDAGRLDEALRRQIARFGLPHFLEGIAVPVLQRVGEEWHAGRLSPAHEHLVSSVFHDVLADILRTAGPGPAAGPVVVFATPAGERHVNGALSAAAFAAVSGWTVSYLGADLPAQDIARIAMELDARMVALSLTRLEDRSSVMEEVRGLRKALPRRIQLCAGGIGAVRLSRELEAEGIPVAGSVSELAPLLAQHGQPAAGDGADSLTERTR
ncbi:MAG TPA: MerR family transcriptional regulator [Gemmatimonadales bacterium]|nr:MerR family transcriptional regulator [Gemmatimonadales bacterium]